MRRVPRLSRSKNLLFLEDRTLLTRRDHPQGGYTVIKSPAPEDLARIVEAVDGVRSLQEICDRLDTTFDAETVIEVIEALEGTVFEFLPSEPPPSLASHAVALVGAGQLAVELAVELAPFVQLTLLWLGDAAPAVPAAVRVEHVRPEALVDRLPAFAAVVAAQSGVPFARALDVNRAALAAGVTCVHVVAEADTLVVGPTTVPYRTVCLECSQINWYFENHAADHAPAALARLAIPEIDDPDLRRTLIAEAARRLAVELTGLLTGTPYPSLLGSLVRLSLAGGTQVHELIPSTNCQSCHGCNRHGIRRFDAAALPELPTLERRPLIADKTGGVRSIELAEARRRAEAAMAHLGVAMEAKGYSKKVQRRYPELRNLPFFSMAPQFQFRDDAALLVARPPAPCFGKGASPEQTMCSGMFEFLERTLHMYRGGVEIVRAPYAAVRDHAIDMVTFTKGGLDIPDRGSRVEFDPALEIDWCWARSLRRDRPVLVPAHSLFAGIVSANDRHPSFTFRGAHIEMPRRGSSGLSAGATREDAVLQGLYEVIEHDARLVHYRSGIPAPAIDPDSIDEPLTKRLVEQVRAAGFELTLRYLSRDIKVPVVEAYLSSKRDLTFYRVPGWGAHHDPAIAIRRAITECVQCIGAAESIASQTFMYGIYSITNSFHEDRYCIDRTEGTVRFDELPRPDPKWASALEYLEAAVQSVVTALPDAELCFFEYPSAGLEGVHVTAVFATHVVCNLRQGHIVQDRILHANRLVGPSEGPLPLRELYLGEMKI